MEILPNVNVEVVLGAFDNDTFSNLRDVVVNSGVMGLVVRNLNRYLALLTPSRWGTGRQGHSGPLQEFALDGATTQRDGVVASMPMDEPLAKVGRHFDINAIF